MNPSKTATFPKQSVAHIPAASEKPFPQSQKVVLIGFPEKIGDDLRQLIKQKHGRDCLRFREPKLASDILVGEFLIRCLWVDSTQQPAKPESKGVFLAIGNKLSGNQQSQLILAGHTAVIDLERHSLAEAATLVCAYAQQAANRTILEERREAESSPLSTPPLTEEQSDTATQYLASAVEMLEIGVYLIDENRGGTISVWNGEMERLFQRTKRDVIGKKVTEVFDDPLVCGIFRDMPATYTRNRAIFPSKGLSKSNFIADVSKTLLRKSGENKATIVGIIQNVTNRIHSENRLIAAFNELESSKDKLEQSNLEIRKGIEKAKKLAVVAQSSNKAKSYFLSNISHELRTPLNSIVSLTYALIEGTFGNLNSKQQEHLEIVSDSSKHLQSLINDILDLSKIELGKMNLKFAQTNIEEVARSSIRMIEQEASQKRVRCILEVNTDRETIEADAKRLRQILLNLLVNAVKFTKANTEVTLRIEEDAETQAVIFHVEDKGIGIDKDDFAKIFSPFTQLDDSLSRQYEGTGLGLAIASKFVELHGGGVRVSSEPNTGSIFTVALPITQFADEGESAFRPALAEVALETRPSRSLLLIVDDNERSALRLKDQVERLTTLLPIITLPNEISAYHDQIAPVAIFVDFSVIGTHGTDWILNAKRLAAWKKTKWIATGSLDLPENHKIAKKLGFDTCSCKPISNTLFAKLIC